MNNRRAGHFHRMLDFVQYRALTGRPTPTLGYLDVPQRDDLLNLAKFCAVEDLERLAGQSGSALSRMHGTFELDRVVLVIEVKRIGLDLDRPIVSRELHHSEGTVLTGILGVALRF